MIVEESQLDIPDTETESIILEGQQNSAQFYRV